MKIYDILILVLIIMNVTMPRTGCGPIPFSAPAVKGTPACGMMAIWMFPQRQAPEL